MMNDEWGIGNEDFGVGLVGVYRLRRALAGEAVAADLSWAAWLRLRHARLWLSRWRQK